MKVNCFQISEGPKLTPCEYSFAIEAIRSKKGQESGSIYLMLKQVNLRRNWMNSKSRD